MTQNFILEMKNNIINTSPSIFLFEYLSCGGMLNQPISEELLAEGFSMLSSLIKDFHLLYFNINLIIDSKLKFKLNKLIEDLAPEPLINVIFLDNSSNFNQEFEKSIINSEFILIIAPEFQNILYNFVKKAELIIKEYPEKKMLNPSSVSISIFSDKILTEISLNKDRFIFPSSFSLDQFIGHYEELKMIKSSLKFPEEKIQYFFIKPVDGAGALDTFELEIDFSTFILNSDLIIEELKALKNLLNKNFPNQNFIIQNKIEGIPLSISAIAIDGEISFLIINSQILKSEPYSFDTDFKYLKLKKISYAGGETPYTELPSDVELYLFSKVKWLLYKYKISGFIGIDFIYTQKEFVINNQETNIFFIEVNPRITTPYIALSEIFRQENLNLAMYFFEGIFIQPNERKLGSLIFDYHAVFQKDEIEKEISVKISKNIL